MWFVQKHPMRGRLRGKMDTEIGFSYQIQSVLGTMRFCYGTEELVKDRSVWQRTGNNTNTHTHTLFYPSFYSGEECGFYYLLHWCADEFRFCQNIWLYDLVSLRDVMTIAKRFYDLRKLNMCRDCPEHSVGWQLEWKCRQAEPLFAVLFCFYCETISLRYLCCCNQSIEEKVLQCNWEQWPVFFLPAYPSL